MQAYSGMQPAGQYNSNGHHPPDSYRASPSQPHSHGTPLLPPIHDSYESTTMQSQQPYLAQQMNGAQMPHPPPYNPHPFQYPNGAMQPAPMLSNAGMNGQRFAIPPQAAIPIAAARGAKNKEVKRRTKTGCLTCRKRRIKVSNIVMQLYMGFAMDSGSKSLASLSQRDGRAQANGA